MKSIVHIGSLLLLIYAISSCTQQDSPFTGTDNRLLELSITSGKGAEYNAVLVGENTFQISVPLEADLTKAKAKYRISEQASILPDPRKIEDWNSDQAFQVKSYAGQHRTYQVLIVRKAPSMPHSVVLTTDDEVATFASQGVSMVEGHLIIGAPTGSDSISNVDALTSLQKVNYNIIVNPTYKGKDLSGLRNVEETGAVILRSQKLQNATFQHLTKVNQGIEVTGEALKIVRFPELQEVDGALSIRKAAVTNFELPQLLSVGSILLEDNASQSTFVARNLKTIKGNWSIMRLDKLATITTPKLELIEGNLEMNRLGQLGVLNFNKLEKIGNFTYDTGATTQMYFNQLMETGAFCIKSTNVNTIIAPHLQAIGGDFKLEGCAVSNLNQMSVETISGSMTFTNLSNMQDMSTLLQRIKKVNNVQLTDINADGVWDFSRSGVQSFKVERCRNAEELIFPEKMVSIEIKGDGSMQLPAFVKVSGVKELSGDFVIGAYNLTTPQDIELGLEKVRRIQVSASNLLSIKLPELVTIESFSFSYITNAYGTQKSEFKATTALHRLIAPKVVSIDNLDFNLHDLEAIEMPALKSINTELAIKCYYPMNANNVLTNLNTLTSLEKVKKVSLSNLKTFRDYSFLKKAVESNALEALAISGCFYQPTINDLKSGKYIKE